MSGLLAVWACTLVLAPLAVAQSGVSGVVDRAVAYVDEFQRRFGSMVTEERYEQSVQEPASLGPRSARPQFERVVLVSDFLLVQLPGEGWTPFRDVFERNGQKIRDREERLAKLFLNGASQTTFNQARRNHGGELPLQHRDRRAHHRPPTLPGVSDPVSSRPLRVRLGKRDETDGTVVEFHEVKTPTYIATTGGRDLPVSSRFWVDEATGAIRRTELDAVDTAVEAHIKVTYRLDDGLRLWVPVRMEERYRNRHSTAEVRGVATYSRFRKFQVNTSEEIAGTAKGFMIRSMTRALLCPAAVTLLACSTAPAQQPGAQSPGDVAARIGNRAITLQRARRAVEAG